MKVLILGASGIIGQHMRLCVPEGIEPVWFRQQPDLITRGSGDLSSKINTDGLLRAIDPDVIINLAGESSPDVVERDPQKYHGINIQLPLLLAAWCSVKERRLIQISSQSVFGGDSPPYDAGDLEKRDPLNCYGHQKMLAEDFVLSLGQTVMRLTFVLGIRPLPHVGRKNPLEAMIEGQSPQVNDRLFSPLMAWDAAEQIWKEVSRLRQSDEIIVQCGIPQRWSRYEIAKLVNPAVQACRHQDFPRIAPRPLETTYAHSRHRGLSLPEEIGKELRGMDSGAYQRSIEMALFFGIRGDAAWRKLAQGFGPLHNAVSDEWRKANPHNESEILDFYRTTEAYIWELSAYHEDAGFNYAGMCEGIVSSLKARGVGKEIEGDVLCLGDGIGDMTLAAHRAGLCARYHDMPGSRTQQYADFRLWRNTGKIFDMRYCTEEPFLADECAAIVSLDFLEHVSNVEEWVRTIHASLEVGGYFVAQNAFACGSGPEGAMPMHLACNDRFEKDWDPLLKEVGFEQLASNWYRRI